MNIEGIKAVDLVDSTEAASTLSTRFGRSYGIEAVRKLVERGKLQAFYYDGCFKAREGDTKNKGKYWLFLKSDLDTLEEPKRGRRW